VVDATRALMHASYTYDAHNRRTQQTGGGTSADLYYSADCQVLEERVGGAAKAQYVWSPLYVDALVLRDRDVDGSGGNGLEERLYVQQDANWDVTALVGVATGGGWEVKERYVYDPYGAPSVLDASWGSRTGSSYGWVYLHQGGRYDANPRLYHFRNRDLSPTLGRWMQNDPLEYGAGDTNLYRYEANGPTGAVDPGGLQGGRPTAAWHHLGPG
jgi:RHS repeat-associated protein